MTNEEYTRVLAEERQFKALKQEERRHRLKKGLRARLIIFSSLTPALLILATVPPFNFYFLAAGIAMVPFLLYTLFCMVTRKRWIERTMKRDEDRAKLKSLGERSAIRANLLMQKQAQDEIDRLKAEIESIRNTPK